jgi:hypothetical protein
MADHLERTFQAGLLESPGEAVQNLKGVGFQCDAVKVEESFRGNAFGDAEYFLLGCRRRRFGGLYRWGGNCGYCRGVCLRVRRDLADATELIAPVDANPLVTVGAVGFASAIGNCSCDENAMGRVQEEFLDA